MEDCFGKIHSIETGGTVDGPGIRFLIFMQGCPLRCKYCHNRDTWNFDSGNKINVSDLVTTIKRYVPYMKASNGGVTISGGEPLLQPDFILNLFKELHQINIHTCIDTAGSLPLTEKIKELINKTDLFLVDIKHIVEKKCKELTGSSNKNELAFINYLSSINKPMWIRQVLIPGITDNEQDLLKLKEYLTSLSSVQKFEFLPYHDLGKYKWKEFQEDYPLEGIRTANEKDIERANSILDFKL